MNGDTRLSIASILRKSSKLSLANILGYVVNVPVQIYVAGTLGPENYGIVGYLAIWQTYVVLIKPGFVSVLSREIPHYLGKGEPEQLERIQLVGISAELTYALLPFTVLFVISFLHDSSDVAFGFMLAAFTLLFNTLSDTLTTLHWANQRYRAVTLNKYIQSFMYPALTLVSVYFYGLRGVFVANLLFSFLSFIQLYVLTPSLKYRFQIEKPTVLYLVKIGIIMQVGTILYTSYSTLDRTLVAAMFGMTTLGLYTFVFNIRLKMFAIITDFGNVLRPMFWTEVGKERDVRNLRWDVVRISLLLVLAASILASYAQSVFGYVVSAFVPKYAEAVPIFGVLVFSLSLSAASLMFENILLSRVVNKVTTSNISWLCGIVAVAGCSLVLTVLYPGEILIVPLSFVLSVGVVFAFNLLKTWKYVFDSGKQLFVFISIVAALLCLQLATFAVLSFFEDGEADLMALVWRFLFVTIVWGSVTFAASRRSSQLTSAILSI